MTLLDIQDDEYLRRRGIVATIDHPQRGRVFIPGDPIKMSESRVDPQPAPLLGADNQEVLGDLLGLTPDQLGQLAQDGVI
jgi:formyl-CoA transferase